MSRRSDPVTGDVTLEVLGRDGGCVAVLLGELPSSCSGRLTLDHVYRHAGGTKGVRAPSRAATLVTLCEGHTEPGMRSGSQWNTANRQLLRRYLEGFDE
jgi:hypothetical protein